MKAKQVKTLDLKKLRGKNTCTRDVNAYLDVKWDMLWAKEFVREYTDGVRLALPAMYNPNMRLDTNQCC